MDLWIRSQDKERIVKTNQLDVMEFDTDVDPRYNHFGVYANDFLVGEYKTKERALEVLDEIQKYLTPTIQMLDLTLKDKQVVQVNSISVFVYEIPKE